VTLTPPRTATYVSARREFVGLLDVVGRHDKVAQLRLERFLRTRGYEAEADRVA
jgi:hypothetical protein